MTVICYYNTTTNEPKRDTQKGAPCVFLAYYTYKTVEEAQKEVDEINQTKPEKLFNGLPAKCDERTYFVSEQSEMY